MTKLNERSARTRHAALHRTAAIRPVAPASIARVATLVLAGVLTVPAAQAAPQPKTTIPSACAHADPEMGDPCRRGTVRSAWLELADGSRHAITVEVIDGQAYFEGDILVDLDPDGVARFGSGPLAKSTGKATGAKLWPDNTVFYEIEQELPDVDRVYDAIDHYEANTNLRFVPRTTETDYVTFRRRTEGSCSSAIGRSGGQQFINLKDGCGKGATIHEIGHAVGFFHEQSRSDRDETLTIHWENIQEGKEHNFRTWIEKGSPGFDHGPHDLDSIMHYGPNAFSANGEPTITLVNGDTYSIQRQGLSDGDIAGIDYLYPPLGDRFGAAIVACDFDGDGLDDVAVGTKLENSGDVPAAGAVRVFYGADLPAVPASGVRFAQADATLEGEAGISDRFGAAIAGGDFDGDGRCDLAVGVPGEAIDGAAEAGAVHVLYGASTGLDTGAGDQVWHQDVTDVSGLAETTDRFGEALAAGDFDGDGYADLAIGVPGEAIGSIDDAGSINVLYGGPAGLQVASPADQSWHQDTDGIKGGSEQGDRFGEALASGDFDGDGYADLAIGVPGEAIGSVDGAGMINVLYGGPAGLQDGAPEDQTWHQDTDGVKDSVAAKERFGRTLAAGDFDGDGRDDLAIGVPGESVSSQPDAGMVNVLYGSSSGLSAQGDDAWDQDVAGVNRSADAGDIFGKALASGDFDGDGYADLAIGAPGDAVGSEPEAGAVHVLYGTADGLQTTAPADQSWTQASAGVSTSPAPGEKFGRALAAGDVDGDGTADLLVGAPQEMIDGANAGIAHVLYGSASGAQTSNPAEQKLTDD